MLTIPRLLGLRHVFRTRQALAVVAHARTYADTPKTDINKQVMVQGTENEERVRVRRARPADVPRVLRYVRQHARSSWPGLAVPAAPHHLVLCDYVARALAQGHSMLAEQQEAKRGWNQIKGLALGVAVCPWDASMIEKWSRCIQCVRSRRLMQFQAHCLRAPALHDKYGVHNILQVILIVPEDNNKNAEITQVLAKNAIKRGREVGFQLVRFDVTTNEIANFLEDLNFKKEWQLSYGISPDLLLKEDYVKSLTGGSLENKTKMKSARADKSDKGYIAVYTANPKEHNMKI